MSEPDWQGGCECGAVRYAVAGRLRPIVACHCSQCRRFTGHFLAATAARRSKLTLIKDAGLRWYDSSDAARRGFWGLCGSTAFLGARERHHVSISAGSLDDSRDLAIVCHIHVADKGTYYDIEPGVTQIRDGRFAVPLPE